MVISWRKWLRTAGSKGKLSYRVGIWYDIFMSVWDDIVGIAKKYSETSLAVNGLRSAAGVAVAEPVEPRGRRDVANYDSPEKVENQGLPSDVRPMLRDYIGADNQRISINEDTNAPWREDTTKNPKTPIGSSRFWDAVLKLLGPSAFATPNGNVIPTKYLEPDRSFREHLNRHEMVHSGQFRYGWNELPTLAEADKHVFGGDGKSMEFLRKYYSSTRNIDHKAAELGASMVHRDTTYGTYDPVNKDTIFNYLDLAFRKNPKKAPVLEAHYPDPIIKQYIQDRPRQISPKSPAHDQIMQIPDRFTVSKIR